VEVKGVEPLSENCSKGSSTNLSQFFVGVEIIN